MFLSPQLLPDGGSVKLHLTLFIGMAIALFSSLCLIRPNCHLHASITAAVAAGAMTLIGLLNDGHHIKCNMANREEKYSQPTNHKNQYNRSSFCNGLVFHVVAFSDNAMYHVWTFMMSFCYCLGGEFVN